MLFNHISKIYRLYVSQNVIISDEKVGMWQDLDLAAGCTVATFVSRETGEMHEHISQGNRQSGHNLDRVCLEYLSNTKCLVT